MNLFPESRQPIGIVGGGVQLFIDAGLTQRASLFDVNGKPLPGNALNIPYSGVLPVFQSTASLLYLRAPSGEIMELYPSAQKTAPVVTGSKGANAALTSLMAALSSLGLVVDSTT